MNPKPKAGVTAAAMFTGQTFIAGCILAAGIVVSCEVRATKAGECLPSYGGALVSVITGAGLQANYLLGLNTINPALDPIRRAQLREEMEATAGAAPPPPPTPDWALDPRLTLSDHGEDQ